MYTAMLSLLKKTEAVTCYNVSEAEEAINSRMKVTKH